MATNLTQDSVVSLLDMYPKETLSHYKDIFLALFIGFIHNSQKLETLLIFMKDRTQSLDSTEI